MWSSIKTHGSKIMTKNTFHGDPRQSLWRWRAQAEISGREASLIAPSGSENERVSCFCQKLSGSKAKKRGASRDVHASSRSILVANINSALA